MAEGAQLCLQVRDADYIATLSRDACPHLRGFSAAAGSCSSTTSQAPQISRVPPTERSGPRAILPPTQSSTGPTPTADLTGLSCQFRQGSSCTSRSSQPSCNSPKYKTKQTLTGRSVAAGPSLYVSSMAVGACNACGPSPSRTPPWAAGDRRGEAPYSARPGREPATRWQCADAHAIVPAIQPARGAVAAELSSLVTNLPLMSAVDQRRSLTPTLPIHVAHTKPRTCSIFAVQGLEASSAPTLFAR